MLKNTLSVVMILGLFCLPADATISGGSTSGGSGSSSGAAGGDLSGSYPNPTVSTIGGQTPGTAAFQPSTAFDASGAAAIAQSNCLQKSNNLSDLANTATARTNLGLGSAAITSTSAYDAAGAAASVQSYFTSQTGYLSCNSTNCNASVSIPASALSGSIATANGGTGCTGANCYYGLTNFRKKLSTLKTTTGNIRLCFLGDSTTFGSYSTSGGTGDLVVGSFPTQLTNFFNNNFGVHAERNSFMGDGGAAATNRYGANDARVVMGSSWSQDTAYTSFGGATFMATTSTNALAFTPSVAVDTFKIMYITQPSGGVLSVNIDGGTATTYNTSGTAGLATATLTIAVGSAATHTINFNWSSGGQVDVVGVYDAYDSTQNWVSVVNMGWPGVTSTQYAVSANAYNPGNSTSWVTLGCDAVFNDLGINDWNAGTTSVANYTAAMQTLITAEKASGTTDIGIITPVPSGTIVATQASQQLYVNALYGLANTNGTGLYDMFARFGSYTAGNTAGLYNANGNQEHPDYNGYADEAMALAQALVGAPGQANNYLGLPYTLYNPGLNYPLTIISPTTTYGGGLTLQNVSGHPFQFNSGGTSFPNTFYVTDTTANANLWSASSTAFGLNASQKVGWTNSTTVSNNLNFDTFFSRISAGIVGAGVSTVVPTGASMELATTISVGTKFTASGCSVTALTGGASAGTYTSGMAGTCTTIITMDGATGITAPNGWACSASDRTTPADIITQTASTTTTATLAGTTASGDVVSFYCMGY